MPAGEFNIEINQGGGWRVVLTATEADRKTVRPVVGYVYELVIVDGYGNGQQVLASTTGTFTTDGSNGEIVFELTEAEVNTILKQSEEPDEVSGKYSAGECAYVLLYETPQGATDRILQGRGVVSVMLSEDRAPP